MVRESAISCEFGTLRRPRGAPGYDNSRKYRRFGTERVKRLSRAVKPRALGTLTAWWKQGLISFPRDEMFIEAWLLRTCFSSAGA